MVLTATLTLGMAGGLTGCGRLAGGAKADMGDDPTVVLRIANCEEYIDLGNWAADETITLEDPSILRFLTTIWNFSRLR